MAEITIKGVEGNPLNINVVMNEILHHLSDGVMETETVDFYPDTTKPVRAYLDSVTARRQYCPSVAVSGNTVYLSANNVTAGVYTLTIICTDTNGKTRRFKSDACIEIYDITRAAEVAEEFDSEQYTINGVFYTFMTQADWAEENPVSPAYIWHKPDLSVYATDEELQAVEDEIPNVPEWAMQPQKPTYTAGEVGAVPTSRTVNGKALSEDITLNAQDVGAQTPIADLAQIREGAAKGATAYQKPSTGIAKSDLTNGIQQSLDRADTALQAAALSPLQNQIDTINNKIPSDATSTNELADKNYVERLVNEKQDTIDDLDAIRRGAAKGATAYQLPSNGMPKTDLAVSVQQSLDKADTAYQKPSSGIPKTDLAQEIQQRLNIPIDDEPTAGSNNLVKSGGVENKISQLGQEATKYPIPITESGKFIKTNGTSVGAIENDANWSYSRFPVSEGDVVVVNGVGGDSPRLWAFIDSSNNIIGKCSAGTNIAANGIWIPAPTGAVECILNTRGTQTPSYLVKKDAVPYTLSSLGGKINNRVYGDGGIEFPQFPKALADALIWNDSTAYTCFYLPVFKGQKIKITANQNYSANYALIEYPILPTYNHQETGVGMTAMQFVTKGTTKEITAPKDCVLYIRLLGEANRTPVKVEIFGLEQTSEQVETLKPVVKELQEQVLSLSGGEKEPYGVGEYGNWASGYIFTTNGDIIDSSVNSHTDYIEVGGADEIELVMGVTNGGVSDAGICFYDSNKVFIPDSGVRPRVGTEKSYESRRLSVPDGAVYLRTSLYNEFTQYWYLKRYYSERFIEKDFFINEVLIGSPSLHLFPAVTDTQTIIDSKTAADLYAEYDAIATAHPEFLSRDADLGDVTLDGVTYAVRAYTFGYNKQTMVDHEPTNDEVISDNKWDGSLNPRKILLVSGMHGEEHTPCWGMMLAIKDIIESNDEWAQYIKSNFIFKVIPCLNPAGWSLCVRTDSQGHTLNRDESYNDPEATYYMDWVNANKDAFILIDCHGTQGRYAYLPVQSKMPIAPMIEKLANKLGASFFANWRAFYESIVAGFGTTYSPFIVAKYSPSALWTRGRFSCRMYEDYGMQSFALETPDNLVNGYLNSNDLRNCKLTKDIFVNTMQFICGLPSLP